MSDTIKAGQRISVTVGRNRTTELPSQPSDDHEATRELHRQNRLLCGPDCVACWGDGAWMDIEGSKMIYWRDIKDKDKE